MRHITRRAFMGDIGTGMLAAGLGTSLVNDFGMSTAFADDGPRDLPLGKYESLVDLMRSSPPESLQVRLTKMLLAGECGLTELIGAGAIANAVTFGGSDYVGFHTAMAMIPALELSRRSEERRRALPVLKVLYRNAQQIQTVGGKSHAELHRLSAAEHSAEPTVGVALRDACRKMDVEQGERLLAGVGDSPRAGLNAIMPAIQDDINVHRFVMAYRTFHLAEYLGPAYSQMTLRQSVRLCCDHERDHHKYKHPEPVIRTLLPKLLDQYRLEGKTLGTRHLDDPALESLAQTIYGGSRDEAAEAIASALADGIDPEEVGEAISLASNRYVLQQGPDKWRTHGDAAGVHSSDATSAWRGMVRVADARYTAPGLIVAGYHAGTLSPPFQTPAYPTEEHRRLVKATDAQGLLAETEDAIRHNDQGRACAAMAIYGEKGFELEGALDLFLRYAVSEDGRLHGEKYFQTVVEEYRTTRPAFRWRQVVALARVTSSAFGYNRDDQKGFRAAGYEEACRLLGVEA